MKTQAKTPVVETPRPRYLIHGILSIINSSSTALMVPQLAEMAESLGYTVAPKKLVEYLQNCINWELIAVGENGEVSLIAKGSDPELFEMYEKAWYTNKKKTTRAKALTYYPPLKAKA